MSWFASFGIAFLTAIAGGFASGLIGALCVDWYHISGREGGSGYFVIALFLLGLVVGGFIGLVASRVIAGGVHPGALKALGVSMGIVLGIGVVVLGIARALADVPPTIGGEALMLAVEVRWPEGEAASPATTPGEGTLSLGSIPRGSHTVRASNQGVLWKSDTRLVDGRWVMPGAVQIFTSRGGRLLLIGADAKTSEGFLIPLPGSPGKKDMEWSDWMPRQRPGGPAPTWRLTVRFKVQKVSTPIRTEAIGPFEVLSAIHGFYNSGLETHTQAAVTEYTIRYKGKPYVLEGKGARFEHPDAVAVLAGDAPALLVHVPEPSTSGLVWLLTPNGDSVRADFVSGTFEPISAEELTSDSARFALGKKRKVVRGWVDRETFDKPGVYLVGNAVLDTRHLTSRPAPANSEDISWVPSVPALGLSPDERSFVRFGYTNHSEDFPALIATDVVDGSNTVLPIDRARMHYPEFDALDPAWVLHHFGWEKKAGVDRLVERRGFVPLPWKGVMTSYDDSPGYRLQPGAEPLRAAIIEFLVKEFHAEVIPTDSGSYKQSVRIEGQQVNVSYYDTYSYIVIDMERGSTDSTLVPKIAAKFDALLATGKLDALFTK